MSRKGPSLWRRLAHASRRGVLFQRLAERLTRKPRSALDPILSRLLGTVESPVLFEFGVYDGAVTAKLCGFLKGPPAAYYAWEPDPRNIRRIRERGLPPGVELVEVAVGNQDGKAVLHLSGGTPPKGQVEFTYGSSLRQPTEENAFWFPWMEFRESVEVTVRGLDSFCRERRVEKIDLIWADIQGAEKDLILSGPEALRRTKYMLLEQEGYRLYEGQWLYEEMMQALQPHWRLACRFPSDVLLYNTALVAKPDCS